MLAKLSFGLKDLWRAEGFTDAFEGPVDVANRVAELLMLRQGLSTSFFTFVWQAARYGATAAAIQTCSRR